MNFRGHVFILSVLFLIVSCGDDNPSNSHLINNVSEGQVVNDYYHNAKVCIDINENLRCDDSELSVFTDETGHFSLRDFKSSGDTGAKLIAEITKNTFDEDGAAPEYEYILTSVGGCSLISPVTSIANYIYKTGLTAEEITAKLKDKLLSTMEICSNYPLLLKDESLIDESLILDKEAKIEEVKHIARIGHIYSEVMIKLMAEFNSTEALQEKISHKQKIEHANFLFQSWTDDILSDLNELRKNSQQTIDAVSASNISAFRLSHFDFSNRFRINIEEQLSRVTERLRSARAAAENFVDLQEQMDVRRRKNAAETINVTRYLSNSTADSQGFYWYRGAAQEEAAALSYMQLITEPYSKDVEENLVGTIRRSDFNDSSDSFTENNLTLDNVIGPLALSGGHDPEVSNSFNYVFTLSDSDSSAEQILNSKNIGDAENIENQNSTPLVLRAADKSYSFTLEAKSYSVAGLKVANVLSAQSNSGAGLSHWNQAIKNKDIRFASDNADSESAALAFDVLLKAKGSYDVERFSTSQNSRQGVLLPDSRFPNAFAYHSEFNRSLESLIANNGHQLVPLVALFRDGDDYIVAFIRNLDTDDRAEVRSRTDSLLDFPPRFVSFYSVALAPARRPFGITDATSLRNIVLTDIQSAARVGYVTDFEKSTINGLETLSFAIPESVRRRNPDFGLKVTLFMKDGVIYHTTNLQDSDEISSERLSLNLDAHKTLIKAIEAD